MGIAAETEHAGWPPTVTDAIALVPVAVLALMTIPLPFAGDQALFATGAGELRSGLVLYRDFWDIKQPGIYWFFGLARYLGRGPAPVHVVEVLSILVGAVVLQRGTRSWFAHRWVSSVTPILVYAPYLMVAGDYGATQIEELMAAPLAVCLVAAFHPGRPRSFVAGLAGGLILVFKLLFAPLIVVVGIGALIRDHRRQPGTTIRRAVPFVVGAAALPAAALVWLLADHAGSGLLWRTTVSYPQQLSGLHGSDLARQLGHQLLNTYSVTAPLALLAVIFWRRRRAEGDPRLTLIVLAVLGLVIILPQRWSAYQAYIDILPIGLLAAAGVDHIVTILETRPDAARRAPTLGAAAVVAIILLVPPVHVFAPGALRLARHGLAVTQGDREAFRRATDPQYAQISDETSRVRPLIHPGDSFYAIGNPLYYQGLGTAQAIAVNGWAPEQISDRIWTELIRELTVSRPRFLFIEADSEATVAARAPQVLTFVARAYHPIRTSPATDPSGGTWYQSNGGTAGPRTPNRL